MGQESWLLSHWAIEEKEKEWPHEETTASRMTSNVTGSSKMASMNQKRGEGGRRRGESGAMPFQRRSRKRVAVALERTAKESKRGKQENCWIQIRKQKSCFPEFSKPGQIIGLDSTKEEGGIRKSRKTRSKKRQKARRKVFNGKYLFNFPSLSEFSPFVGKTTLPPLSSFLLF